ncbi:MAG: hypothetical protein HY519_00210, partial [Candidatus Aenigmarchaeota archaeon]|nr:hypothetical protein [Candidatus Aenigmarchaeota archaeon]
MRAAALAAFLALAMTLSALAVAQQQVRYQWDEVNQLAGSLALRASENTATTQTIPKPQTPALVDQRLGGKRETVWNSIAINFNTDFRLERYMSPSRSKADKPALNVQSIDEVCVGDTLKTTQLAPNAEWYSKGGPHDSPPVLVVDNLDSVIEQITAGTYKAETYSTFVCAYGGNGNTPQQCIASAQVICQVKCSLESTGLAQAADGYVVAQAGEITASASCTPQCILFVDRQPGTYQLVSSSGLPVGDRQSRGSYEMPAAYGYMKLCGMGNDNCPLSDTGQFKTGSDISQGFAARGQSTLGRVPAITRTFSITAKPVTKGSSLQLTQHTTQLPNGRQLVRIEATNDGDTGANIEGLRATNAELDVLYAPAYIAPGETQDIIAEVAAEPGKAVEFAADYEAETIGCQEEKDYTASVSLQAGAQDFSGQAEEEPLPPEDRPEGAACSEDAQCAFGNVCCAGTCHEQAAGVCEDTDGD